MKLLSYASATVLIFMAHTPRVATAAVASASWTAPTLNSDGSAIDGDLAGYRLYFGIATADYTSTFNGTASPLTTPTAATTYDLAGVPSCTPVYYTVTAYDFVNNESVFANEVQAILPARPSNITMSSNVAGTVTLNWQALPPGDSGQIDSFRIHYGAQTGGPYNGTGAGDGNSPIAFTSVDINPTYTLTGLPTDSSTFITIEAICTSGTSRLSLTEVEFPGEFVCTDPDGDGYGVSGDASCPKGPELDCDNNNINIFPGAIELCNGIDDNCADGADEGWPNLGDTCADGVGACTTTGVMVCSTDGLAIECDATASAPAASETCDGVIDDDCDGTVDNGCPCTNNDTTDCYGGASGTEDIGLCTGGTQTCTADTWGSCVGQVLPTTEICGDGIDQDCDGEDLACPDCNDGDEIACYSGPENTAGVGVCAAGIRTCSDNTWGSCTGEAVPAAEDCGTPGDDDCDGLANEDCAAENSPSSVPVGCGCGANGTTGLTWVWAAFLGLVIRRRLQRS